MAGTISPPLPSLGPGDWSDFNIMDPIVGPIDLSAWFVRADTSPPPREVKLSGNAGALARQLLLENLAPAARKSLDNALTESLSLMFDAEWQKKLPDTQREITETLLSSDDPGDVSIYELFLPQKGELRGAIRSSMSPEMVRRYPAGVMGSQLDMVYAVSSLGARFRSHALDLWLKIWVKIKISIGFPHNTKSGVQLITTTMRMPSIEGDGIFADIALDLGRLFGMVDDPAWTTDFSTSSGGFGDSLRSGFALAHENGFIGTRLSAIEGTTVIPTASTSAGLTIKTLGIHIDLDHLFDNPPIMLPKVKYLPGAGTDDGIPLIQLDRASAYPKDEVHIRGQYWPHTGRDRYLIHCAKSTSGTWRQTEIQAGVIQSGQNMPSNPAATKVKHSFVNANDEYITIPNLPENAHIGYRVRQFDLPDFIATRWTPWISVYTGSYLNNTISIYIDLTNGTLNSMTTSAIDVQPDGTIDGTFELPSRWDLFSPGQHQIVARLTSDPQITASIPITISDETGSAAPRIQIVNMFNNPNGDAVTPASIIPGTQYLRGYHLKPNALVKLWLDGVNGGTLQQMRPDFTGTQLHPGTTTDSRGDFFTNFEWSQGRAGEHRLFVVEEGVGGRILSLPIVASGQRCTAKVAD
ncbi:hypothetical protein EJ08DRAFT_462406 [Tothia fuscella]|uniref:Uncharacterized protein n=1 Tax=Tothia fuscella TaxID=1048955 RepID=A0A9P4NIW1_9PEZI|nr:hypothetical protein EJ08DRAFT_462406 [Tothia fuscella]